MIETVTSERRKRGDIARDMIAEMGGGGFPRSRAKSIITPYDARMRLMEELKDKPPEFQTRSLRRRLTAFDRALSDDEAYALDRANNAWLSLNGKSKSVDPSAIMGNGSQSEPLNDGELKEANAFRIMRGLAGAQMRFAMNKFFEAQAPWNEDIHRFELSQVVRLAKSIKKAYEQK